MTPVIFVGHGSPMNAIENNTFTDGWRKIAQSFPKPNVILAISAHWFTRGTHVLTSDEPKAIYDFYGFPKELSEVKYSVKGSQEIANKTLELLDGIGSANLSWGIDHGTWSVLVHMYPEADIPVLQLSIDATLTPKDYYNIGKKLKPLREMGVLILGSGNIVHNLRAVNFSQADGFDWADQFDDYIMQSIISKDLDSVINYTAFGQAATLSVPTPDHFNPILYCLGAAGKYNDVTIYNKATIMGSLSMTSYVFT